MQIIIHNSNQYILFIALLSVEIYFKMVVRPQAYYTQHSKLKLYLYSFCLLCYVIIEKNWAGKELFRH